MCKRRRRSRRFAYGVMAVRYLSSSSGVYARSQVLRSVALAAM